VDEIRTEIKILEPLSAAPKPTSISTPLDPPFFDEPLEESGPVLPLEQQPKQNASVQKRFL
jgi:hypothetical protein